MDKHKVRVPGGHSADVHALYDSIEAFVNEDPTFLQSTGFVLDPDGNVLMSVYSNGAIGRLLPEDVIGLVRYVQQAR